MNILELIILLVVFFAVMVVLLQLLVSDYTDRLIRNRRDYIIEDKERQLTEKEKKIKELKDLIKREEIKDTPYDRDDMWQAYYQGRKDECNVAIHSLKRDIFRSRNEKENKQESFRTWMKNEKEGRERPTKPIQDVVTIFESETDGQ